MSSADLLRRAAVNTPHLIDVRALTLKNPWADLIARSDKRVENRSWMPYEGVSQILIHAGKGWDRAAPTFGVVATSAIVAVADITFACDYSRHSDTVRCGCGKWAAAGQCHWNFGTVWTLPEPVGPVGGMQGLWRPDAWTVDAVRAQLAERAS